MFTGQLTQDSRNAGGSPEERPREGDIGRWLTGSLANIRHDISSLRRWTQRILGLEFGESEHGGLSPLFINHWTSSRHCLLNVTAIVIVGREAVTTHKSPSR